MKCHRVKRWLRKFCKCARKAPAGSEAPAGTPGNSPTSSAKLSKGNAFMRPRQISQPAAMNPPTAGSSDICPATPDTASNLSPGQAAPTDANAAPTASSNPNTDARASQVDDVSLWDIAYDTLATSNHDFLVQYENLLMPVLIRFPLEVSERHSDANEVIKQWLQHTAACRREMLKEIMQLGLSHAGNKSVNTTVLGHKIIPRDAVASVAETVELVENTVENAINDVPYTSIVIAGVSLVLPLLRNPAADDADHQDAFTYVTSQLRYYEAMERQLLPEIKDPTLRDQLSKSLVDLYQTIITFHVRSVIWFYRSRTERFFREVVKCDDWKEMAGEIRKADADLISKFATALPASLLEEAKKLKIPPMTDFSRYQLGVLPVMKQPPSDRKTDMCLRDLRVMDPRSDKKQIEATKGGLLEDSYSWVLDNKEFRQWRDSGQDRLLWVKGDPGKGKTMLLCGIVDHLGAEQSVSKELADLKANALLSYFFCQGTDPRLNNTTAILRGLMYMLASQQPALVSHVREKYDHIGKQLFEDRNAWRALTEMFANMLKDPQLQSAYLIIDALDECTGDTGLLLDFIVEQSSVSPGVKWIVSSRHWPSFHDHLGITNNKPGLYLELNHKTISAAVGVYTQHMVMELTKAKGYSDDLRDTVQDYLLSHSHDTFLWVALVCQELHKIPRWKTLKKLRQFPYGLDKLYQVVVDQICSSDEDDLCRSVLAAVSTVYKPITLDELRCLVYMPDITTDDESLEDIIALCGFFLTVREGVIRFVHQSAKDYLLWGAFHKVFPLGVEREHEILFERSLENMSKKLTRDVYNLVALESSIDDVERFETDPLAAVRYSCVYWIHHLHDFVSTSNAIDDLYDDGLVENFLSEHFLHWLEALSLLGSMSTATPSMVMLEGLFEGYTLPLADVVRDGRRFVQHCTAVVETYPLQVYASALVFSPAHSITRSRFSKEVDWVARKPYMQSDWCDCFQTFELYGSVSALAWLADGKRIGSVSRDRMVRIWNVVTGQCTVTIEHHGDVETVALWGDGQQLASGSDDGTVKIWDIITSRCTTMFQGHGSSVYSLAWSADGQQLVSGYGDGEIKIWDLTTGRCTTTFQGHGGSVYSLAWSADGQQLASGFHGAVKTWRLAGQCTATLESHDSVVSSVAWSADGQQLALGSDDGKIKIWDLTASRCTMTFQGHDFRVSSVAWSSNGQQVASGSDDKTVKIWDLTDQCTATVDGHSSVVSSVAWSTDGRQLASGSSDHTIKIWDPATSQCTATLKGHRGSVSSVSWSSDGRQLASGSWDKTINIWDPAASQCTATLNHNDLVHWVAWSANRQHLASASQDKTVKIWDIVAGQCTATLEHKVPVYSVIWSADGQQFASYSQDKMVKLWDATTYQCTKTFQVADLVSFLRLETPELAYTRSALFNLAAEECPDGDSVHLQIKHGLSEDGTWIKYHNQNQLWVPPEYRPFSSDITGTSIAIGCYSGRVLIFEFAETNSA